MLYPLAPKLDYLTTDNMLIAAAFIGALVALRLIYTRLTRSAHMSGTMSRR